MSLNVVAWVSVTLFLVHEFEEIVFIKPWLRRHRNDPRARRTAFWSFADTTTSTIAALIFEEYVLFVIVAFISVSMGNAALLAGLLVPYALHLVGHIIEALRLRMRTISVATSVATLPWYIYAVLHLAQGAERGVVDTAIWSVVFFVVIAANFGFIYAVKPHLNRWIEPVPN